MAPVGLLPEHDDESWVIAKIVDFAKLENLPKIPHYVVHPKDSPVVQKVVPKASILDWVSPRVLEAFEFEEGIKRDTEEEEKEKRKQEHRRRFKGKKRGRPFKTPSATRETSIDPLTDNSYAVQNLFPRQPSLSQPSFSQTTLSLKRKTESSIVGKSTESTEDETGGSMSVGPPAAKRSRMDMNTEHKRKSSRLTKELISSQNQKNIAPSLPPARRLESMDETKLSSLSIETANPPTSQRSLRDRSSGPYFGRPAHASGSVSVTKTGSPMKPPSTPASSRCSMRSSSAAATSLSSPAKKPVPSSLASQKTSEYFPATPSKKPSPANKTDDQDAEAKQNDKKEWEVISLLDDKYHMVFKRRQRLFLVQWAGGYEPTWEKWSSIAKDLRDAYDQRKRRETARPAAAGATVINSSGGSAQASSEAASARSASPEAARAKAAEDPNNSSLFVTDDEEGDNKKEEEDQQSSSTSAAGRAHPGARVKRENSADPPPVVPDYSHKSSSPVARFLREMEQAEEAAEVAAEKAAEAEAVAVSFFRVGGWKGVWRLR